MLALGVSRHRPVLCVEGGPQVFREADPWWLVAQRLPCLGRLTVEL